MTCDSQIDVKSANHALEITILKTSFRLGLACVLALAVVAEANACASASIGRTIQGAQFKVELSASLPDAKILTALGLDPAKMKRSREIGPDGEQNIFRRGKVKVSIIRSVSTGVFVTFSPNEIDVVEWDLCPGSAVAPNTLIQRALGGAADR